MIDYRAIGATMIPASAARRVSPSRRSLSEPAAVVGPAEARNPHPSLSRSYIEAQLIALATIRPDVAAAASRRAWRSRLSADCLALLDAIVVEPSQAWRCLPLLAESEAQWQLAWSAQQVTLGEMTFHSLGTLLALARGPLREGRVAQEDNG